MARVVIGLTALIAGGFFGLYIGKKTIGYVQTKVVKSSAA